MLGHDTAFALPELQEADESRMKDRFIIDRVRTTGDVGDDGRPLVEVEKVVYDGPGRVSPYFPHGVPREVAMSTVVLQNKSWRIPVAERMAAHVASGWVSVWDGPVKNGDRVRRVTAGKHEVTGRVEAVDDATTEQTAQLLIIEVGAQ